MKPPLNMPCGTKQMKHIADFGRFACTAMIGTGFQNGKQKLRYGGVFHIVVDFAMS